MRYPPRQQRALDVIMAEIRDKRRCVLSHIEVAQRAGVGKSTVRTAVERAERAGEVRVIRRPDDGASNLIRLP